MGDDLKSSAVVWGGKESGASDQAPLQNEDDSPPAYTGAEPSIQVEDDREEEERPALPSRPAPQRNIVPREPYNPIQELTRWSQIPFSRYNVLEGAISADRTTIITTHATFLSSQHALSTLVAEQAKLPPLPTLRITGQHVDAYQANKVDFDLTLNLHALLELQGSPAWRTPTASAFPQSSSSAYTSTASGPGPTSNPTASRFGKHRASSSYPSPSTPHLPPAASSTISSFLREKSDRKSLTLVRSAPNLPLDVLEGQVRTLIASLNYRGKVGVAFPVRFGKVVVQRRPMTAGGLVGGWVRNVLGLSSEVNFEAAEIAWGVRRWADDGVDEGVTGQGQGHGDASALVRAWWSVWAPAIRDAVLARKMGVVGFEDWIQAQMGWREKEITKDWGVDYSA